MLGGNLYAAGQFNLAGGIGVHHLAMWNGAWSMVKAAPDIYDGTDANINTLLANGTDLYVGGTFSLAGSWNDKIISRWDTVAKSWFGLGNSLDQEVTALAVNNNIVYAGGMFQSAGGLPATGIARLDGFSHTGSQLGSGVAGCDDYLCFYPTVYAILVVGQDVYIGGNFYAAGGVAVHSIARWNMVDQKWHALGNGVACGTVFCNADVYSLTAEGGCVIVGGSFDTVNGANLSAHNLAQWCGTSWSNVVWNDGSNHIVETNGPVYALTYDNGFGLLYAGGSFSSPVANLFSLDYRGGVYPVGDPVNGAVRSIVVAGPSEYIAGDFINLSANPAANYIAEQTGSSNTWLPLGNGLNNIVESLALQGNTLIAGGNFTTSGATGLSHLASWDGSSWSPYGSGTDNLVFAVAVDSNFIYAGGSFLNAGGKPAAFFSRWGAYHSVNLPIITK